VADVGCWLCANVSNLTYNTGLRLDIVDPRSPNVAENVLSLPDWRYAGHTTTADNGQLFLLGFPSQVAPMSDKQRPLRVLQLDVATGRVVAETVINVPPSRLFFSGTVAETAVLDDLGHTPARIVVPRLTPR
jgi:hypothetical protein